MSKASKDMDIGRRQASAGQLLYQDKNSSVQGGVMNFGKTRDEDGTVDRVPDPPDHLKFWLLVLQLKIKVEEIDLEPAFVQAGGTRYGTITKRQVSASQPHPQHTHTRLTADRHAFLRRSLYRL